MDNICQYLACAKYGTTAQVSHEWKKKETNDNQALWHIHVQYCDVMRFMVLHNRHHKVSQSVPFFMQHKTVTILLRIRVRGHFVMSNTKYHESHHVTVLNNPPMTHTMMNQKEENHYSSVNYKSISWAPFPALLIPPCHHIPHTVLQWTKW